jgi:hypothetical protein
VDLRITDRAAGVVDQTNPIELSRRQSKPFVRVVAIF